MRKIGVVLVVLFFSVLALVSVIAEDAKDKPYKPPEVPLNLEAQGIKSLSDLSGNVTLIQFGRLVANETDNSLVDMNTLLEARKDKPVKGIRVNVAQKDADVKEILSKYKITCPIINDSSCAVVGKFKPGVLPSLFVIDKFGFVRYEGPTDLANVGALVDSLVSEEKAGESFYKADPPAFAVGSFFPPIQLTTLGDKSFNIYQVINNAKFTFIFVTYMG
jgi:hypothetical protein